MDACQLAIDILGASKMVHPAESIEKNAELIEFEAVFILHSICNKKIDISFIFYKNILRKTYQYLYIHYP